MDKGQKLYYKILLSIIINIIGGITIYVQTAYSSKIIPIDEVSSPKSYAMILGASLQPNGTPSDALLDRIKTGALLYNAKKASKILITGDDGQMRSNEVAAMKKAVLDLGVKEQDVVIDGQGYRTYESCKRAKEVYKIDDMIVVTQRFHLGRALYLCNTFGVDAIGVSSDLQSYQNIVRHWVRDLLASNKAWYDINIEAPRSPVTNL